VVAPVIAARAKQKSGGCVEPSKGG